MNVLETAQYLIEKVTDMVITESLGLEKFVKISFHETLDDVDILHGVQGARSEYVTNVYDIFMIESR